MKLSYKYEPNKDVERIIKEKCDRAAGVGATTFHDIEIREDIMPSMSGLMESRVKNFKRYKYGENVGASGGTKIKLTSKKTKSKGEVITKNPNIDGLFYGRMEIHTTKKEHIEGDIDKGNPSFRDKYGENLEVNKNATDHWSKKILSGANFRNEILKAIAYEFNK